jgi:hypothetical protein
MSDKYELRAAAWIKTVPPYERLTVGHFPFDAQGTLAALLRRVAEKEREACAAVADYERSLCLEVVRRGPQDDVNVDQWEHGITVSKWIAAAIRSRSTSEPTT